MAYVKLAYGDKGEFERVDLLFLPRIKEKVWLYDKKYIVIDLLHVAGSDPVIQLKEIK